MKFYGDLIDLVEEILEKSERSWEFQEMSDEVGEVLSDEGENVTSGVGALPFLLAWNATLCGSPISVEQVQGASLELDDWEEGDDREDEDDDDEDEQEEDDDDDDEDDEPPGMSPMKAVNT